MQTSIRFLCLLLALAVFPAAGRAEEPVQIIEAFLARLKAGQASEAVDDLYSGNKWMAKNSDAILNIKNKLGALNEMIGDLKNYEQLQQIALGTRFIYFSYLAAYERQPIRFVFEFYRPEDAWVIFGFTLDDNVDDDVEKAAQTSLGRSD